MRFNVIAGIWTADKYIYQNSAGFCSGLEVAVRIKMRAQRGLLFYISIVKVFAGQINIFTNKRRILSGLWFKMGAFILGFS